MPAFRDAISPPGSRRDRNSLRKDHGHQLQRRQQASDERKSGGSALAAPSQATRALSPARRRRDAPLGSHDVEQGYGSLGQHKGDAQPKRQRPVPPAPPVATADGLGSSPCARAPVTELAGCDDLLDPEQGAWRSAAGRTSPATPMRPLLLSAAKEAKPAKETSAATRCRRRGRRPMRSHKGAHRWRRRHRGSSRVTAVRQPLPSIQTQP